jgi:hypothetical protein
MQLFFNSLQHGGMRCYLVCALVQCLCMQCPASRGCPLCYACTLCFPNQPGVLLPALPAFFSCKQRLSTYLKLARIHNLVPSVILVVVGAWVSSELIHNWLSMYICFYQCG